MAEIASAFVSVAPSAKGFGSSLTQQVGGDVDTAGKGIGKRLGGAMKLGLLAAGGAALGAAVFVKAAIGDASDLAESESKVGVVFGRSAGQILKASKTSSTAMGLSKSAYLDATGTLGNLLVSLDIAPKKAAGMSQKMVELASDMASFNNVPVEDALAAIQSGLTGETEPLKKFGVNMNDATLKAQALKMGLIKNTKEALTPQAKALAAQGLIMKQTGTAQGDFARTSGGLANQQKILGAQFSNAKATIGKVFLPLAVKAVSFINKGFGQIGPIIGRVKAAFSGLGGGGGISTLVGVVKANLLPVLKAMATTFTTLILPALQRFGGYVIANVLPIIKQMIGIFVNNVLPVLSTVAQFIFGKLVPAIIKIVTSVAGSLKPVFDALFAQIQTTVLPIVQKLLAKFQEWWPTIQKVVMIVLKVIGVVLRLAAAILGKVLPPLIRFAGFLIRVVVGAVIAVIGVIVKIISKLIDFGKWVIDGAKKVGEFAGKVKDAIGKAIGFVKDLPGKAKDALGNLLSTLKEKGKDLIQGLIDGIVEKIRVVKEKITDALNWVKDHLPGSPIKRGPLKPWNNTGPTGPGGRLMGLLATGVSNSTALQDALQGRLTARVSVPRLGISSVVGSSAASGGASRQYHIYEAQSASATAREVMRHEAFAGGA